MEMTDESSKTDESKSEITPARLSQQQLEEDIKTMIHEAHLAWNAPKEVKKDSNNAQNS